MEFLTLTNISTFGMLILLQIVLGFDNLLYISLESKKAPDEKQGFVRKLGIGIAIVLRIVLLFALVTLIKYFEEPLFDIDYEGIISSSFNVHSLIVLLGGVFIIYTSIKEIWHMISYEPSDESSKKKISVAKAITLIVIMNVVFSFDSILSAMALTNDDQFWLMAAAIIIGGILMIWLADRVANFLEKNRMYEVLGLFILFLVGIMLLSERGHLEHIELFDNKIVPMNKTTFYFILVILILVDVVQGQYQKRILQSKSSKRKQ
ncbi:MAG: tellurium resistance protein TerC [Crocinitomicaceae bacterium]|nr:tellurium resistance protein TerC [Crocinitomicaceae bacterium]